MKPIPYGLILLAVWAVALRLEAAPPPHDDFIGVITRVIDADTYRVRRADGVYFTVRLRYVDAPERDQPLGPEATKWAEKKWLYSIVGVYPSGLSYNRIVASMEVWNDGRGAASEPMDWLLVMNGLAHLDPRYKPTKFLLEHEEKAKKNKFGVWSLDDPIPPWEWRKRRKPGTLRPPVLDD